MSSYGQVGEDGGEEGEEGLFVMVRGPPLDEDDEDDETRRFREEHAYANLARVVLASTTDGEALKVHHAREAIAHHLGLPAGHIKLFCADKELFYNSKPLAEYGVESGALVSVQWRPGPEPTLPRAPLPRDDEVKEEGARERMTRRMMEKLRKKQVGYLLERIHASSPDERLEGVHLWRADTKEWTWLELVLEGPPSSFYAGGDFVLRVVYTLSPLSVRMMTPLYHPSVNYMGQIALLDPAAHSYLGIEGLSHLIDSLLSQLKIYRFRTRSALTLRNCGMLSEEWERSKEEARREAQLWTRQYATDIGRTYHRQNRRCLNLSQLWALMKVDSQIRDEVRTFLLVLHRSTQPESSTKLPNELVEMILLLIGTGRWQPPESVTAFWEMMDGRDDGLTSDWRSEASSLTLACYQALRDC